MMLLNKSLQVPPLTLILISAFLEGSSSMSHNSVDPTSHSVILTFPALSPVSFGVSKLSSKVKYNDFWNSSSLL